VVKERSSSSCARTLGVHAFVVGAGWFVIAFSGLVGLQVSAGAQGWVASWPAALQGMGGAVVLAAAVPLAWPLYIAVGWCESGLASRLGAGDHSARRPAIRLLRVQAAAFLVASAVAATVAWSFRAAVGGDYLVLAWLPLASIGGWHLWTARRIRSSTA
jgi:hypothetical protein